MNQESPKSSRTPFTRLLFGLGVVVLFGLFALLFWQQSQLAKKLKQDELGIRAPIPASEVPAGPNIKLSVTDFGESGLEPTVDWVEPEGTRIYRVELFTVDRTLADPPKETIFIITSEGSLPHPWKVGILPEGVTIQQGALTTTFTPDVDYGIEVTGKDQYGDFAERTYFGIQGTE